MSDDTQQALNTILDRLERIEDKLSALELLKNVDERAPILVDAAAHVANDYVLDAADRGIDVVERGQKAITLAEKASDPKAMEAIESLLERVELLELAVKGAGAVEQLQVKLETGGTTFDDAMTHGVELTSRLILLSQTKGFQELVDAGALDEGTVAFAAAAAQALKETRQSGSEQVGLFGVLGKMGDADIQRAIGFTFALAKRFGKILGDRTDLQKV